MNSHSTTVTDSVSLADTVSQFHAPLYADGFPSLEVADSVGDTTTQCQVMTLPAGEPAGVGGHSLVRDTGVMSLLMLAVFFLVVSYRNGYKYIENLLHNMFSVRRRESLFEDNTVKETQILSALVGLSCVCVGILTFQALALWRPALLPALEGKMALHVAVFVSMAIVFYLVQLVGFNLLGYVFSDKESTKVWIDGFKATQSLLGLLLLPIVSVSLAVPGSVKTVLILAIAFYSCVRIVFICKGFRIFYSNLLSLVYFILYLCSVEIVPLAIYCGLTVAVCHYL